MTLFEINTYKSSSFPHVRGTTVCKQDIFVYTYEELSVNVSADLEQSLFVCLWTVVVDERSSDLEVRDYISCVIETLKKNLGVVRVVDCIVIFVTMIISEDSHLVICNNCGTSWPLHWEMFNHWWRAMTTEWSTCKSSVSCLSSDVLCRYTTFNHSCTGRFDPLGTQSVLLYCKFHLRKLQAAGWKMFTFQTNQ